MGNNLESLCEKAQKVKEGRNKLCSAFVRNAEHSNTIIEATSYLLGGEIEI